MTTSNLRSFPPADDLIHLLRSTDYAAALDRIITALLVVIAVVHICCMRLNALRPHLVRLLRVLIAMVNNHPNTLDRMVRPKPPALSDAELAIDADLAVMSKRQLMAEYGTKSRRMTKETLVHKIMERRLTNLEMGV